LKLVYLILAHKDPEHLARLITRLTTSNSSFVVHIDKKSDISKFRQLTPKNVVFTEKRVPVYYDYSIIEATLIMLKQALSLSVSFDYFIRLAGVDYPIQPTGYIEKFFEINNGKEFIELLPRYEGDIEFPLRRIERFYFRENSSRYEKFFYKILSRTNLSKDRLTEFYKFGLKQYWGNALWALSQRACEYVLDFSRKNKRVLNYFKHTHAPEEMLFQIILGNSSFYNNIFDGLHYIDWSNKQRHPPELTENHLDYFSKSLKVSKGDIECLFANKFSSRNKSVVDKLDLIIEDKERQYHGNYG